MTNNVMTLQQFTEAYKKQNPHDKVQPPPAIKRNWATIVPLFVGLISVNVLSAFHTGPLIAKAYATVVGSPENTIMFIFGVLAVEFVVFVMMFARWDTATPINKAIRLFVIVLAVLVSIIANVNATMVNLGTVDTASTIAAGLVGIFAPLANLSIAEVLRSVLDHTNKERKDALEEYNTQLKAWDTQMRTRFANYLKRYGITDATTVMQLSSGQTIEVSNLPQSTTERKSVIKEAKPVTNVPPRIVRLAETLVANGDTELSYKDITQKYGSTPADISKAKKYLQPK